MGALSCNIIGAGKLGKSIAYLIHQSKLYSVQSVLNRNFESSRTAVEFIGAGQACQNMAEIIPADLTLITVPDDYIKSVCDELVENKKLKPHSLVIHCSGILTIEELVSAKQQGCHIASVHPMHSFANPTVSIQHFSGTHCAIETNEPGIYEVLEKLFTAIGGNVFQITGDQKALYHAAGAIACNYLVTLNHVAIKSMKEAGVSEDQACALINTIQQNTVNNLANVDSATDALTGPLQRGDVATLEKHIASLPTAELRLAYKVLGRLTLELTQHDTDLKNKLLDILSD